jgi:hypothetical protein
MNVRLRMVGQMPMPVDVLLQYKDGSKELVYVPQLIMFGQKPQEDAVARTIKEPWKWTHPTYTFDVSHKLFDIKSIEIDPTWRMADINRQNNKLELNW